MREVEVAAGILWQNGRFLAVERPPGGRQAGFWEFPGGKIEPGESPEAALARELVEELGVRPREASMWKEVRHAYDDLAVRLYFFQIHAFDGVPSPLEGQRFAWVDSELASRLNWLPADRKLIPELCRSHTLE